MINRKWHLHFDLMGTSWLSNYKFNYAICPLCNSYVFGWVELYTYDICIMIRRWMYAIPLSARTFVITERNLGGNILKIVHIKTAGFSWTRYGTKSNYLSHLQWKTLYINKHYHIICTFFVSENATAKSIHNVVDLYCWISDSWRKRL